MSRRTSSLRAATVPGSQVDAKRQDAVHELGLGVADHGEVRVVTLRLLAEPLSFGPLDRRHPAVAHGLGPLAEAQDHLLRVEGRHGGQRRG